MIRAGGHSQAPGVFSCIPAVYDSFPALHQGFPPGLILIPVENMASLHNKTASR